VTAQGRHQLSDGKSFQHASDWSRGCVFVVECVCGEGRGRCIVEHIYICIIYNTDIYIHIQCVFVCVCVCVCVYSVCVCVCVFVVECVCEDGRGGVCGGEGRCI
jgi:hypothetical protein